jgi:hypothetical protein
MVLEPGRLGAGVFCASLLVRGGLSEHLQLRVGFVERSGEAIPALFRVLDGSPRACESLFRPVRSLSTGTQGSLDRRGFALALSALAIDALGGGLRLSAFAPRAVDRHHLGNLPSGDAALRQQARKRGETLWPQGPGQTAGGLGPGQRLKRLGDRGDCGACHRIAGSGEKLASRTDGRFQRRLMDQLGTLDVGRFSGKSPAVSRAK